MCTSRKKHLIVPGRTAARPNEGELHGRRCVLGDEGVSCRSSTDIQKFSKLGWFQRHKGICHPVCRRRVKMFRDEKGFDCNIFNPLVPFFDKIRDPEANAFVINVLVCDKPSSPNDVVFGSHVDDTLAHSAPGITFLAHAVSVLYISVPPDMSGGELELLGPAPSEDVVPEDFEIQHVAPVENRMAQFRGDSYHQVRGYSTDTDIICISLVLEQYRVAPAYQNGVDQYVESVKGGMTMM
jgi:hypothetical protein